MRCVRPLLLCVLAFPLWCSAVRPYTPRLHDPILEPWRWRDEEALKGLGVLCMDEAPDGTLWFGGIGTLASYDGVSLTKIQLDEELLSKIKNRKAGAPWVKSVKVLPDGSVLALIGDSLVLRRDNQWRVVIPVVADSSFDVKLLRAKDGTFWLLVPGELWRIRADLSAAQAVIKTAPDRPLMSFCFDAADRVWVVQQTAWDQLSLVALSGSQDQKKPVSQKINAPLSYLQGRVDVAALPNGKIVLSTAQRDVPLYVFDPKTVEWVATGTNKSLWAQSDLCEAKDGSIWIRSLGKISRLTPQEKMVEYPDLKVEVTSADAELFETSDQRLWMIGRGGTVRSVDLSSREWQTYIGLNFECETESGVQWFRTGENAIVISHDVRTDRWSRYELDDQLIDTVFMIFHSSHGLVWAVGSHEELAALAVFDGKTWTRHLFPEFAKSIRPNGAFEASDGTVWFGAQGRNLDYQPNAGGALQFKVTENRTVELVKHHSPADGFPYYVTAFAETPDGSIWLGSTLVQRLKKDGSIERFPELQGENVAAMAVDPAGSLWLAKEYFGVCRWTDGVWTTFASEEGLSDLKFSNLRVLLDGSVLVTSGEAFSRFDGLSWSTMLDPKWFGMDSRWSTLRVSPDGESLWLNYVRNDPKISQVVEFNNGFCAIRYRMEKDPPDTRIDRYLERVPSPGNLLISWSAQDGWSRTAREQMHYSWRMDGQEWSVFSKETSHMFLNLSSGRHVLEVRSRDQAFNIDPTPARVEFTVIAPIWQQAWFITMIVLFSGSIAGLIWLLIRTRERHLKERQAEREAFLVHQQEDRERHLLEQQTQLVERQKEREQHLQEVDRIKTGFFTNISHELRTPMTVVAGRLEMIFQSEPDEKRKNSLSIILRNAQRVSTLITQLLDFRKLEEGKLKVETTQGDLVPPVKDWVASLQVLAEQARLSLSLETVEEVRGAFDFDKLQKIFTNLMSNSIKYTKAGGEIRVLLRPECKDDGTPLILFAVEDTGVGISQEHLPRIFDRFYRVTEASMAEGAGIGLNLTKELVDLLGGEIQVESPIHPDATRPGTRFTVRLPFEAGVLEGNGSDPSDLPDPADPTDRLNQPSAGESPMILVVEDDEDIRSFIFEGLSSEYRVETAKNGEAGLQKAKELVPDLVVTDVMMPVMDGMELCRGLKTSLETSHIPVVMLTAKTAVESQIAGLKTGADDYITKPFHMEILLLRIANLLESRRILRDQFLREYSVLAPVIPEHAPDKEFLEKVVRVMEANYTEITFGPDELAAALNMSRSTLQRKLKAATNRTRSELICEFRMAKAAEQLVQTNKTVLEITFDTGFDEASNFARQFKKQYGKTPSQYREEHRPSFSVKPSTE